MEAPKFIQTPAWAPYFEVEVPVPPRRPHFASGATLTQLLQDERLLVPCADSVHLGVPTFPYILGNPGEVHIMTVADHAQVSGQPAPYFCDLPPRDQITIAALIGAHILDEQFASAIASTNEAAHGVKPPTPRTAFQHHVHLVGYPERVPFGIQKSPLKLRESVPPSTMSQVHASVQSAFDGALDFALNQYNCLTADITDHVQNAAQLARLITQFEIALVMGWKLTRKKTIFMISPDDDAVDMHETPAFSVGILRGVHDDPKKVYMYGAPRFYTKYGGLESQGIVVRRVESPKHSGPTPSYLAGQMQYAQQLADKVAFTLRKPRNGADPRQMRVRSGLHRM